MNTLFRTVGSVLAALILATVSVTAAVGPVTTVAHLIA